MAGPPSDLCRKARELLGSNEREEFYQGVQYFLAEEGTDIPQSELNPVLDGWIRTLARNSGVGKDVVHGKIRQLILTWRKTSETEGLVPDGFLENTLAAAYHVADIEKASEALKSRNRNLIVPVHRNLKDQRFFYVNAIERGLDRREDRVPSPREHEAFSKSEASLRKMGIKIRESHDGLLFNGGVEWIADAGTQKPERRVRGELFEVHALKVLSEEGEEFLAVGDRSVERLLDPSVRDAVNLNLKMPDAISMLGSKYRIREIKSGKMTYDLVVEASRQLQSALFRLQINRPHFEADKVEIVAVTDEANREFMQAHGTEVQPGVFALKSQDGSPYVIHSAGKDYTVTVRLLDPRASGVGPPGFEPGNTGIKIQ